MCAHTKNETKTSPPMVNAKKENYKDAVADTAYLTSALTTNKGYIYF